MREEVRYLSIPPPAGTAQYFDELEPLLIFKVVDSDAGDLVAALRIRLSVDVRLEITFTDIPIGPPKP